MAEAPQDNLYTDLYTNGLFSSGTTNQSSDRNSGIAALNSVATTVSTSSDSIRHDLERISMTTSTDYQQQPGSQQQNGHITNGFNMTNAMDDADAALALAGLNIAIATGRADSQDFTEHSYIQNGTHISEDTGNELHTDDIAAASLLANHRQLVNPASTFPSIPHTSRSYRSIRHIHVHVPLPDSSQFSRSDVNPIAVADVVDAICRASTRFAMATPDIPCLVTTGAGTLGLCKASAPLRHPAVRWLSTACANMPHCIVAPGTYYAGPLLDRAYHEVSIVLGFSASDVGNMTNQTNRSVSNEAEIVGMYKTRNGPATRTVWDLPINIVAADTHNSANSSNRLSQRELPMKQANWAGLADTILGPVGLLSDDDLLFSTCIRETLEQRPVCVLVYRHNQNESIKQEAEKIEHATGVPFILIDAPTMNHERLPNNPGFTVAMRSVRILQ